ncbi:MAG: lipopolysaccharide biosynthesis protein [Flavobacteriaceae bacterium]|nr:lipopolysaccharide biosynthesis protein [Flavobacteriaceae bacterium]
MATLSVIVPTFNEAPYLEDALHSVSFADEIIVIDSFSTDATAEIAEAKATKVLQRKFDTFSEQKNYALEHATCDWVLFLDADERVTHSLENEIMGTLRNPRHGGYRISFPHFYMNRFLYHHSDTVLRLVKREGAHFTGKVHEKLHCEGTVGRLENPMLHYTYKGLHPYIKKKERYAWFQAEQAFERENKATWFHLTVKPAYRFFSSYVLKGGFRDGIPGLAVATVNAYGVFQRYVKLRLLQKNMQ